LKKRIFAHAKENFAHFQATGFDVQEKIHRRWRRLELSAHPRMNSEARRMI
jgi:hypothetical protein